MRLSEYELGMLHCANRNWCRIYLGRKGCELSGYVSGRWWTALSLWMRGYLKRDRSPIYWNGYGTPSLYLIITDKGRTAIPLRSPQEVNAIVAGLGKMTP